MNRTDKQELARRLEAIMSDLRYATDLEVPDFETMADELYDMGATINEYVDNILQGASEDRKRKELKAYKKMLAKNARNFKYD